MEWEAGTPAGLGIEGLKLQWSCLPQNSSQDLALSSLGHLSLGEQRIQSHLALHELCFSEVFTNIAILFDKQRAIIFYTNGINQIVFKY